MSHTIDITQPVPVVVGVDTHADEHEAAVLDTTGRMLAHRRFPADDVGYQELLAWASGHGPIMAAVAATDSRSRTSSAASSATSSEKSTKPSKPTSTGLDTT
jgi:hypothetical protein